MSPFALAVLIIAVALVFDYINGFHDTANAVATVVSTNVLPGRTAVLMAAAFNFGGQRKLSGSVTVERGSFYSGHKTAIGLTQGRVNFTSQFSVEPTYSVNKVDLPDGAFGL